MQRLQDLEDSLDLNQAVETAIGFGNILKYEKNKKRRGIVRDAMTYIIRLKRNLSAILSPGLQILYRGSGSIDSAHWTTAWASLTAS